MAFNYLKELSEDILLRKSYDTSKSIMPLSGHNCQGCKFRKSGEFKAEYASRDAYRQKHGSVP